MRYEGREFGSPGNVPTGLALVMMVRCMQMASRMITHNLKTLSDHRLPTDLCFYLPHACAHGWYARGRRVCSLPSVCCSNDGHRNILERFSFPFHFHTLSLLGLGRLRDFTAMNVNHSLPWASDAVAQGVLTYTQIAYPIILLLIYLITFTVRSITTARNDNDTTNQPEQLGQVKRPSMVFAWIPLLTMKQAGR